MADTEREAFEAWVRKDTGMPDWARFNWQAEWVKPALEGWMARAALASRPAEVDDEGLPAVLFDGHAVYSEITRKLGKAHCHSHETVSATLDAVVRLMRAAPAERAQ